MVFGWGKKQEQDTREKIERKEVEIKFTEIEKVLEEMHKLREKTLISEVKVFRNKMEPEKNEVLRIVNDLEKDNLKMNEMDPHLQGLVKRGKKEVISTIQNNSDEFVVVNDYDGVKNFESQSNRMLKKFGDVLGRHSRVIHIFAKKYAKQFKNYLQILKQYHDDIKQSIDHFNKFVDDSKNIINYKDKIIELKDSNINYKEKISKIGSSLNEFEQNIKTLNSEILELKDSPEYLKYQKTKDQVDDLMNEEDKIKHGITEHFTKISRPIHKYVYISSLEKSQKILLEKLESNPYDVIDEKNKSDLELILDSVCKNVISGSISVKDTDRAVEQITEIKSTLPEMISTKQTFLQKSLDLKQNLTVFDNSKIINLDNDIKKNSNNLEDSKLKIAELETLITKNEEEIPDLIFDLETNLYRATSTKYIINWDEDAV